MDYMQIVLILLALAGVWAVVELALTIRKTRKVAGSLDKTIDQLNNTIAEAQPIVSKLDGAVDELGPALTQIDPLLKSATTAVDALTSDLVEIEGVVRDVSSVSGAAADASNVVTGITSSASDAVQRLLGKKNNKNAASSDRALETPSDPLETLTFEGSSAENPALSADTEADALADESEGGYFTYASHEEVADHE